MFNAAPYMWLLWINTGLNYNLPPELGGRLPTDVTSVPGDYLSKLKFAAMSAADAQYDRFSLLTDFMYVNGGTGSTNIKSLDFFGLSSQPISRSLEASPSTTLKASIWTVAGGYTVVHGDWGNFDVLAGFRYLGVNASTSFNLATTVVGPRGNGATFGGVGYFRTPSAPETLLVFCQSALGPRVTFADIAPMLLEAEIHHDHRAAHC